MKSEIPAHPRPIKPKIQVNVEDVKHGNSETCVATSIGTISVDGKNMATWFTLSNDLSFRIGELVQKFYEHKL